MRRARPLPAAAVALSAVAVALCAPAAASAASAQRAIAELNAQRSANGIPAGITENGAWSAGCAKHDHYMALNNAVTHSEAPSSPGYSAEGAMAAPNAVLGRGINWDRGNPYESAPLHLDQLLAPRLIATGSADAEGYSCTTTFPGWSRPDPAALTVYTYPGNRSRIYRSETARELPRTPGQLAGLPRNATTGPYLIVLVDAPGQSPRANPATLGGATLTGPRGPVRIVTLDGNGPDPAGGSLALGNYISPGGFIIPVAPLSPATTYHAHVVVGFAGMLAAHDWSFTTIGSASLSRFTLRGSKASFASRSPAALTVTLLRTDGLRARTVRLRPGASTTLPTLRAGIWSVCGHQDETGTYAAFDRCYTIRVGHIPSLGLGPPRQARGQLQFPVRFSSVLRGHAATLTVVQLTLQCAQGVCTTHEGSRSRHKVTVNGRALSFALPAAGHGLRLVLATGEFTLHGAQWAGAQATRTFVRS